MRGSLGISNFQLPIADCEFPTSLAAIACAAKMLKRRQTAVRAHNALTAWLTKAV
jgi:hypothetical protein